MKRILLLIGILLLVGNASAIIAYDVINNKIVVIGYSEIVPCNFIDVYNADKSGTLSLHARTGITGTDGAGVAIDRAEQPADYIVLGGASNDLYIVVENFIGTTVTIRIIGTDRDGTAQTEDIIINVNGQYNTTKWFKTITHTQVTGAIVTSFDYDLMQGQWGRVWKQGGAFKLECKLYVGDGIDNTYLKTESEEIYFHDGAYPALWLKNKGHFRMGKIVDSISQQGSLIKFYSNANRCNQHCFEVDRGGYWEAYDTTLIQIRTDTYPTIRLNSGSHIILNSVNFEHFDEFLRCATTDISMKDIKANNCKTSSGGFAFGILANIPAPDGFQVYHSTGSQGGGIGISDSAPPDTWYEFKNAKLGYNIIDVIATHHNRNFRIINSEWEGTYGWQASGIQTCAIEIAYSFNLKVVTEGGVAIDNANVSLYDKDDNIIFEVNTSGDGIITEQIVTKRRIDKYPFSDVDKSPHKIEIKKEGYQTYTKKFTMDKIDWEIALLPECECRVMENKTINIVTSYDGNGEYMMGSYGVTDNIETLNIDNFSINDNIKVFVEFNISSIPVNANIINIIFKYNGLEYNADCNISNMTIQPSNSTPINIYNDIGAYTIYSNTSGFPIVGNDQSINLGIQAVNDLQAKINISDWFSIGIFTNDAGFDSRIYASERIGVIPPPTLMIEYQVPVDPCPPENLNIMFEEYNMHINIISNPLTYMVTKLDKQIGTNIIRPNRCIYDD